MEKKVLTNTPQTSFEVIQAQTQICCWGRGTGKTSYPEARRSSKCANIMPGSVGLLVGDYTIKVADVRFPPIKAAWLNLGYREGIDFFVNKRPDKKKFPWWQAPANAPSSDFGCVYWINGSVQVMVGLNNNFNNAMSVDYALILEPRTIHQSDFEEVIKCVRGNDHIWGHLSDHGSLMMCTDRPREAKEKWIIDHYKNQVDEEVIDAIVYAYKDWLDLKLQYRNNKKYYEEHPNADKIITNKIAKADETLNLLRKNTVHISYASSLDNYAILGSNVIKSYLRDGTITNIKASVLNIDTLEVEKNVAFYPTFEKERNTYSALNIDFVQSNQKDYVPDCRWYFDDIETEALPVALDYNHKINWIGTGMMQGDVFRVMYSTYILRSEGLGLRDVVNKFCQFYKYRQNKTVKYIYDNTALQGKTANNDIRFHEEVSIAFRENGWHVIEDYIGQAFGHTTKYYRMHSYFAGNDARFPKVELNIDTNEKLIACIPMTASIQIGKEVKKDKSSETKHNIPPENSTHGSDMLDSLICAELKECGEIKWAYIGRL
jgi:GTP:adenosylcobinamide-phosphate guanylyltransferase